MNKFIVTAAVALFMVSPALGQTEEVECPTDFIGPGAGPLWEVDKAVDNAVSNPGDVARERAAEACNAVKNNNENNAQKAVEAHNRAAARASERDTEGLQKAERILEGVRSKVPGQAADAGIGKALSEIGRAKNRRPEDVSGNKGSGQDRGGGPVDGLPF